MPQFFEVLWSFASIVVVCESFSFTTGKTVQLALSKQYILVHFLQFCNRCVHNVYGALESFEIGYYLHQVEVKFFNLLLLTLEIFIDSFIVGLLCHDCFKVVKVAFLPKLNQTSVESFENGLNPVFKYLSLLFVVGIDFLFELRNVRQHTCNFIF